MLTKGAIGNLVNRYKAVLAKCNLINTFGSLAVAAALVLGGAGVAGAETFNLNINQQDTYTYTPTAYNDIISGTVKADYGFIFKGNDVETFYATQMNAKIDTDQLCVIGSSTKFTGFVVSSDETLENVDSIYIESNSLRTGIQIYENTNINFDKKNITLAGSGDARVQIQKGGSMTIGNLISQADDAKVQLDDESSEVTIKSINVQKGKLNLEVLANNSNGNATFNIGTIDVAQGTRFNASVYHENQPNIEVKGIDGNLTINLAADAVADLGGVKNNDWRSDKISINADQVTVNVADINSDSHVYLSKEGTDLDKTSITVSANGENNSGDVNAALEKMAGIVQLTSNNDVDQTTGQGGKDIAAEKSVAEGTQLSIGEGMHAGAATATVGKDGKLENKSVKTNSIMSNVLDLASSQALSMNRILMNDVRKRLGDIRADEGTHGVWMRYDGGKLSGSNGYENDFNTFQIGVDTKPTANAPRFGMAFAYTNSDADMKRGSAEMDAFSFAAYATKIYDNGLFVDVIGRVASADTDVVVDGNKKGSMDNLALSVSGELGWRANITDRFYIEPQAELTYTYINSESLTLSSGHEYDFDAVDSLVGRVGVATGIKLPDNLGDVYVRASVVNEFLGEATVRGGGNVHSVDGDDTWFEYGIGANMKLTDSTYVWADVERTEGAEIEEEWRGTVGFRFSF